MNKVDFMIIIVEKLIKNYYIIILKKGWVIIDRGEVITKINSQVWGLLETDEVTQGSF